MAPVVVEVAAVAVMVKYTLLSTTLSTLLWLLRTDIFGLESTRRVPKDSSMLSMPVMSYPLKTDGPFKVSELRELTIPPVCNPPLAPLGPIVKDESKAVPLGLTKDQSMPCW